MAEREDRDCPKWPQKEGGCSLDTSVLDPKPDADPGQHVYAPCPVLASLQPSEPMSSSLSFVGPDERVVPTAYVDVDIRWVSVFVIACATRCHTLCLASGRCLDSFSCPTARFVFVLFAGKRSLWRKYDNGGESRRWRRHCLLFVCKGVASRRVWTPWAIVFGVPTCPENVTKPKLFLCPGASPTTQHLFVLHERSECPPLYILLFVHAFNFPRAFALLRSTLNGGRVFDRST